MISLNQNRLRDKIYGCWVGKNIGGTLGTPFEGKQELLHVDAFNSPKGQALANDDLDLQLIWLKALEDRGPLGINPTLLGEYWINYISPHWNEYGIGKCNMKAGLLPPISGNYENDWRHSNGAWIRSEIWACVAPGCPDIAIRYAWDDACVDHGTGEGTYAELFTAAMQSAAFVVDDLNTLIQIGLSKIPGDCRVARSINIVLDAYKEGVDAVTARQRVLDDSLPDLGWFEAPANVAFVVIGMVYGQGDFKKSLLTAINCGDDTDCTGATLGALLGIIYGASGLPEDWKQYIGDGIVTIAIDRGSVWNLPPTCSALTDRVMALVPQVLAANRAPVKISNDPEDISSVKPEQLMGGKVATELVSRAPFALDFDLIHTRVTLDYGCPPDIKPGQEFPLKISFKNQMPDPRHLELSWLLPEGWTVKDGRSHLYLNHFSYSRGGVAEVNITIVAGEKVEATNRGVLQVTAVGRPVVGLIPLVFLG